MRFVERLRSIYDGVVGVEEAHTARERRYCARKSNEGRHRFIVCTSHHHITLLGEFKGELGYKYHLMFLASTTTSGIELRWWIETLIRIREEEGCITGPAFGHKDGTLRG